MKAPLDRSIYEGEWRGDEKPETLLDYFLAIGSDAVTVAQETPGNYVANIMDNAAPAEFTVKRYRKGSTRGTELTAAPAVANTDPAAAGVADITPKGFMLTPKAAGRVVLSLLTRSGTAKGKLIINVLQSPPVTQPPVTEPEQPPVTQPEQPPVTQPEQPPVTEPEQPPVTEPPVTQPEQPPVTEPPVTQPEQPPVTEPPVTQPEQPPVTEPEQPPVTEPPVTQPEQPPVTQPPARKPILSFKVSVGAQPVLATGTDYTLKVRLAVGTLTVTAIADIAVQDKDLKFEYSSSGITVAVWSAVPPRDMKLLILGAGTANLKVTHVPTGAVANLKINIVLL